MQYYTQKIGSAETRKEKKKALPKEKLEAAIFIVTMKENFVCLSIKLMKILSKDSCVHVQ